MEIRFTFYLKALYCIHRITVFFIHRILENYKFIVFFNQESDSNLPIEEEKKKTYRGSRDGVMEQSHRHIVMGAKMEWGNSRIITPSNSHTFTQNTKWGGRKKIAGRKKNCGTDWWSEENKRKMKRLHFIFSQIHKLDTNSRVYTNSLKSGQTWLSPLKFQFCSHFNSLGLYGIIESYDSMI